MIENQTRTPIPSSEQRFRPELGPALGMSEPSGGSALELASAGSVLGWEILTSSSSNRARSIAEQC